MEGITGNFTNSISSIGKFFDTLFGFLNPASKDFIFKGAFGDISSILDSLNPVSDNFFLKKLFDWLNPFSENFFLKTLFDWLNPFSENFFLKKLFSWIDPTSDDFIGKKIAELFSDLFKFVFVPSEDAINGLVNSVKSHFGFVDTINETAQMIKNMFDDMENLPKLTITLPENQWYSGDVTVIDLSWYAPYKQYGDTVIAGFIYVFFLWRIFVNLPNIISGGAGSVNEVTIASSDIDAYHKFGFGRRSTLNRRQ